MSLNEYESLSYRRFLPKHEVAKAMNVLDGLIQGIHIDKMINQDEINELYHWLKINEVLVKKQPFLEVACFIEEALSDGILTKEEQEDIHWLCRKFCDNTFEDFISEDIQVLHGLLYGIIADNRIELPEILGLEKWLSNNTYLSGTYPYDELCSLVTVVLKDGKISTDEQNILKAFFSEFVDTRTSYNLNDRELHKLKKAYNISGICAMCPEIDFKDKVFCFTGVTSRSKRSEIKVIVEESGGIFTNSVSRKVNYLVVGNNGNPCWMFSCYGRKVERAMQLRKEGYSIMVVHENDFWDEVG